MDEKTAAAKDAALSFIKTHNAGVLATAGHDNHPHASVIHYVADDSFNIYFLTKTDSRKYQSIQAHPQVAFVIGRSDVPQTLQIEGVASEITSEEERAAHAPALMEILSQKAPGYVPVGKMDGTMTLMWLQPKWIRWADFSTEAVGNENLFTEIPLE